MNDRDRFRLLGMYTTPRVKVGAVLSCEYRDCDVIVVGYSDGKIPWSIGRRKGTSARGLVIFDDLARAIRSESNVAVAHWWGVDFQTVSHWRKALGVEQHNAGTTRLKKDYGKEEWFEKARRKAQRRARSPETHRKVADALRGRKRPQHVIDAMRKGRTGRSPQRRGLRCVQRGRLAVRAMTLAAERGPSQTMKR